MADDESELFFEFLVGYAITNANRILGAQPKRTLPPLEYALRGMAARLAAADVPRGRAARIELTAEKLDGSGERRRLEFEIPEGYPNDLRNSPVRLLGERFKNENLNRKRASSKGGATAKANGTRRERGGRASLSKWGDRVLKELQHQRGEVTWDDFVATLKQSLASEFKKALTGIAPNWPYMRDGKPVQVPRSTLHDYLRDESAPHARLAGAPTPRSGRQASRTK